MGGPTWWQTIPERRWWISGSCPYYLSRGSYSHYSFTRGKLYTGIWKEQSREITMKRIQFPQSTIIYTNNFTSDRDYMKNISFTLTKRTECKTMMTDCRWSGIRHLWSQPLSLVMTDQFIFLHKLICSITWPNIIWMGLHHICNKWYTFSW